MDWENIFRGNNWFHLTGIAPALSESCAKERLEAIRAAKAAGLKASFDPIIGVNSGAKRLPERPCPALR